MRDLDSLFGELRGQRPPGPFAPPEAVRRRGRVRARRQAAAVAVAVLALAGGGAVTVTQVGLTSSPPQVMGSQNVLTPAPTRVTGTPYDLAKSPTPSSGVPSAWLITTADLGSDDWREAEHELLEGPWVWGECERFPLAEVRVFDHRIGLAVVSYTRDSATGAMPERTSQVLERYPTPELAAENLTEVRHYLAICSIAPDPREAAAPLYEVIATDLAGDESLLVRAVSYYFDEQDRIVPSGHYQFVLVMRVGSVVSTIIGDSPELVREVAPRAAARLH